MTGPKRRVRVRLAALFAVLLLTTLASFAWPNPGEASSQRVLSVTAFPREVAARGGESEIIVRIPADAAGDHTRVTLSTELGAFGSASGPPVINAQMFDVGNNILGSKVILVGDGRIGSTVIRAQVGSLVDTVSIRFVGETTSLRLERPSAGARLDASVQHEIRLVATDVTTIGVPSAGVTFDLVEAPAGASLRRGARSATSSLSVSTNRSGQVSVWLRSDPGDVTISASSGVATLTMEFQLYGEPHQLRLVSFAGSSMEAGQVGDAGSIQALLQDELGQGVPNERVVFRAEGGLVVASDADGEYQMTDSSGTARVHLDSRNTRLGPARLTAAWAGGGGDLTDEMTILVTGPPVALYMRAEVTRAVVDEVLIEEFASSTRYRLYAEVVDRLGQPVSGAYQVRWWPVVLQAGAQVYPQVSVTRNGRATAIFDLQHVDGRPLPESTEARAWLIAKAQVNNSGIIANLLGEGVPLRSSWNDLTWQGSETTVSEAVAEIRDVVSAAWRRTETGAWQAWFTADVPGAVDFTLNPGDSFHLVLRSAALLENVRRR